MPAPGMVVTPRGFNPKNQQPIVGWQGTTPTYGESPAQKALREEQEARNRQMEDESYQRQLRQQQATKNFYDMNAQKLAYDKAAQLSSNGNNPITTTGTQMEVSSPPSVGPYASNTGNTGGSGDKKPTLQELLPIIQQFTGGGIPREPTPTLPPRVPGPTVPRATSALDGYSLPQGPSQAFSRAKDVSGRQANLALSALSDYMTSRGMSGSGMEAERGAQILSDASRYNTDAQFQSDLADQQRAWEATQLGYQGDLTQRGQDLGFGSNIYSGGISQRGQDLGVNQNNLAAILQLLNLVY